MENLLYADVTNRSLLCTGLMKCDGLMFLGFFHSDIISACNIRISVIRCRLDCHFRRIVHIYPWIEIIRCLLSKVYVYVLNAKS